ncbi:MAG: serine/threonine protein kinase [Planctomycetota bacterium]|jgi:serine/threonine protein kinase
MLDADSNLSSVKEVEGYKVLPPCVLYGKIGQGGMGAVYRGRHLNLDIDVAVKCLKPDLTGEDEQFVVRFRREARSAARINHQNVVRVFDVSEEEGLHYIVMELVQGETARQRVQRKGMLSVGEALEIVYGAASGLGEAHSKGFIHRDIKPDNLMIASTGVVKVADLGLAKPSGQNNMSMVSGTNLIMGTPHYMPPEQWENTATVTAAADVWALGATLYYLLVGGEAIGEKSLPAIMQRIVLKDFPDVREKRADVPDDVAEFIQRATRKEPAERFADAAEMALAIEQLATRRQTLQDNATVSEQDPNTLLSPPPAKTLAKIKFWLDEQAQGGMSKSADEGQTIVSSRRASDASKPTTGAKNTAWWPLLAVLVLAGAAMGFWQPWRPAAGSPFAGADNYQRAGQFAAAVSATELAFEVDPALTGKDARLANLHLEWAKQLRDRDDLGGAFEQIANSVALEASPAAANLKRSMLAKVAMSVDAELQRTAPTSVPIVRGELVVFRGRFASAIGRELSIAGKPVSLAADGLFRAERELSGLMSAPVAVLLVSGETITLAPWNITYVKPTSTPSAATTTPKPQLTSPLATKPKAAEPIAKQSTTDVAPSSNRVQPAKLAPPNVPKLTIVTEPQRVEVRGDQPSSLTIRAPNDAVIRIDGEIVERDPESQDYVHQVKSSLERPAAVEVLVSLGSQETRQSVPVSRIATSLVFVGNAEFEGLRYSNGDVWAADGRSVKVTGECNVLADRILVNGAPAGGLVWKGRRFTLLVMLQAGVNTINLVAQRRLYEPVTQQLVVERINDPALKFAEDTRTKAEVESATYAVVFDVDKWTNAVEVVNGKDALRLVRDPNTQRFRGKVPLVVGANRLVARAKNVLGKQAELKLNITRKSSAALPEVRGVRIRVAGGQVEVRPGRQVFLLEAGAMVIDTNDASATVRINGEPAVRSADGTFALAGLLSETKATKVSVMLESGFGRSDEFWFVAWLDAEQPSVQWLQPAAKTVARGQPFELGGTWQDRGGLKRGGSKLGELNVRLSPRGVAKSGKWSVKHAGLQVSTTLYLDVVDRAGNKTRLPLEITVN